MKPTTKTKPAPQSAPTHKERATAQTAREGFSLPEVMVSVGMLAAVIVASTSLLISTSRSNSINANRIMAYYLAQEGIELTRNIRDSNWLQGLSWRGKISEEAKLTKAGLDEGSYIIDKKGLGTIRSDLNTLKTTPANSSDDPKSLEKFTPWTFEETKCALKDGEPNQQCEKARLHIYEVPADKIKFYSHNTNLPQAKKIGESAFYRWIEIKDITGDEAVVKTNDKDSLHFKLTSIVAWEDATGGYKSVEIETELTDWKQGPI